MKSTLGMNLKNLKNQDNIMLTLLALLVNFLASAAAVSAPAAAPKPHLVFVMVDDWGWFDVGFRNPLIKT